MERGSVGATLAVARGQGGRIATASVRAGLAMTGFLQGVRWDSGTHGPRPTIVLFVGQGPRALPWVRRLSGGGLRAARPTEVQYEVRRGGALPLPRATARVAPTDGNKERGKRGVENPAPTHNGGVLQVRGDVGERVWAGQGEDGTV